ncbi:MAG: metalloprotease PmbA, partial [Legionella sp. 21-45-4]
MAFVNHEQGYDVSVRMGQVETVAFSEQQSIAVSVYFGCNKGTASSSDTSLTALKAMVLAAVDIARVSAADACFGLPERELFTLNYPDLDLAHPWALTPSEAISGAIALEEHALQSDSRLTNSDGVSISTHMAYSGFANSYGFRGMVPSTQHQISASFVAKNRNKMQHDYAFTAARAPDGLMPDYALAQLAVERTVNRLDSRRLKTQV